MTIKNFFSTQYLFDINNAYISPAQKLMLAAGAVFVLVAVALKIAAMLAPTPVDSKYRKKFYNLFLTIGLFSLFWYLCRFENVMFFGSRFVAYSILLVGAIWFVMILISAFRKYGNEKQSYEKEQLKRKYLPGQQLQSQGKKKQPRSFEEMQRENEIRQARAMGSTQGGKI